MNSIDITGVDLNLLRTLHALLDEGSVTRAARQLGVGQPATSHALGRLRELFDDPLFVRVGRGLRPTPRAEALRDPLRRWLGDAGRLVRHEVTFDPATTTRTFTLRCPDLLTPAVALLAERMAAEAPGCRLNVTSRGPDDERSLREGAADVLLTATPSSGPGLVQRGLGSVEFHVLFRQAHPRLAKRRRLSKKAWLSEGHVLVRSGHEGRSVVGRALEGAGLERRVALTVPGFLAALVAVSQTDLTFTAPRAPSTPLLAPLKLRTLRPPLPLPKVPVAALWHERLSHDPAHRWFRQWVHRQVARSLVASP
ncbi:MAG: LysR family transcriptional regulator [Sandaracinaceae bacterium]